MWRYRFQSPPPYDSLSHYGIQGQKWGIRRYQNPNGSLTPEGKERYRKTLDDAKRALSDARADHVEEAEGWERELKDFRKTKPEKEEDWLYRNYGDSWKDSKWMKDVWEVDDVKQHAREEISKERQGYEDRAKRHIKEAREEAALFEKRYLMLETKNFEDLSKKDLKRLQKYLDYKGPWPFEDD